MTEQTPLEKLNERHRRERLERERRRPVQVGWAVALVALPAAWASSLALWGMATEVNEACFLACAEEGSRAEDYLELVWVVYGVVLLFVPWGMGAAVIARLRAGRDAATWWYAVAGLWLVALAVLAAASSGAD